MIKTIALDLIGTFLRERDLELSPLEKLLEGKFGNINNDEAFYAWAKQETKLLENELKSVVKGIINKLNEVRDPTLFPKLSNFRLVTATNHLSEMDSWLIDSGISNKFYCLVNSALVGAEKPNPDFYKILIDKSDTEISSILFVDDSSKNIEGAASCGLRTLLFDRTKILSEEILREVEKYATK